MTTLPPLPRQKVRVIDSLWTFFVAVAFVGPLALPLLWRNPRFRTRTKVLGSLAILAITALCFWALKLIGQVTYDALQIPR